MLDADHHITVCVFLILFLCDCQSEQFPWQRRAPVLWMILVEMSTLVDLAATFTYQEKRLFAMYSIQMSATSPQNPRHLWVQNGCLAVTHALAPKMGFQEL